MFFRPSILSILFVVAACMLPAMSRAQTGLDLGASSFQFLKLSLSPRITALGGGGVALAQGAGEAEINPAAAARAGGELVAGQEYPPQQFDTRASHIAWNLPWGARRVTLHARYLGFASIPGWDADNNETTPYEAHTLKLQSGLAGKNFGTEWGGSVAYARNNVADATYSAVLVNGGLRRELPSGFSAGASALNAALWAGKTRETGETVEPPRTLQAGVGYARTLREGVDLALALDARKVGDEDAVFPAGAEVTLYRTLAVRAGYPLADPDNGFTAGIGLRWSRYGFQYAYRGHSTLSGGHGWALEIRDL